LRFNHSTLVNLRYITHSQRLSSCLTTRNTSSTFENECHGLLGYLLIFESGCIICSRISTNGGKKLRQDVLKFAQPQPSTQFKSVCITMQFPWPFVLVTVRRITLFSEAIFAAIGDAMLPYLWGLIEFYDLTL
jgi:hypothetical protein